ncbi:MAG: class C sortase [Peptoniphilaceae bacterium]|nr:class C sortase [Peptoniphilaceae bacterium]MDY6018209.1 class C sortase [Anaerococcus sp.]
MKKNKISFRKVLAYIFILFGVCLITFPFVVRSINIIRYDREYKDFVDNLSQEKLEENEALAKDYNEKIKNSTQAFVDPFTEKDFESQSPLKNPDEIFAYIDIPKLGKHLPIYLDASLKHIAMGVAQISGTDIPIGGQGTRSVIAGHRGWWGDNMFLYIDDLVEGDSIYIKRGAKTLEYKVYSKEVISPYDWDKLKPVKGEDILTLLTCDPFLPPRPNRLLVNAKRVLALKDTSKEKNKENKEDKVDKEEDQPKGKAKFIRLVTFIISFVGLGAFLIILFKFGKYLLFRK